MVDLVEPIPPYAAPEFKLLGTPRLNYSFFLPTIEIVGCIPTLALRSPLRLKPQRAAALLIMMN